MPRSLFCGAGGHCSQSLIGNKGNRWSWANSSSWKVSYPTPVYAPYSDVQNVTMPLARHNPIRVRSAKLWPTVASTMKTGTFRASSCFFTVFIYSIILSHQPHEALDILTMTHLFKAHSIHQNHTWNHIKIVFLRQGSHYCWSARSTTSVLAVTPPKNWQCSKASAINTLRFRWEKTSTMSSTKNPESMEWSETNQSLIEYGNGFRGTMWLWDVMGQFAPK